MPFSESEKTKFITSLQKMHQQGQKLEVYLRVHEPNQDADAVWRSNDGLYRQIDYLIGEAIEQWNSNALTATTELTTAKDRLDAAITDIKKSVNVAKKIIEAAGYLDDAIKVAASVLKAVA